MTSSHNIGVVIIGRNEGDRLLRSLDSVVNGTRPVVYVDSGSTDGSCEAAHDRGVMVVNLDLSIPFTAARARNAGFDRLREQYSDVEYVQFIDGDCEVVAGWLDAAAMALDANPNVVAVCGWRRERYPDLSPYNRICDVEWRMGPVGETTHFGGDVMIRASAFAAVGGYGNSVIAAEDDELSVRLRQANGSILRLDQNSTLHDANIQRLSQWWQRAKRCGYAYAQVSSLHGALPERKFVKEIRRIWLWGMIVPLGAIALSPFTFGLSLLVFGRYPLTALRTILGTRKRGFSWDESIPWGVSCGASVFPEAFGIAKFTGDRLLHRQHEIIEYKGAQTPATKPMQVTGR
ncbi:glycosyltransferase family A protein [Stenomitos frigidus]|uniref:glycosyltransferase family A protein n=1 Tax=Stenomitos frigidus TaxID=1886765 RepID=UPI0015E7D119|nr:glycosyltransferase family A protein [Stenomitos frigidus]